MKAVGHSLSGETTLTTNKKSAVWCCGSVFAIPPFGFHCDGPTACQERVSPVTSCNFLFLLSHPKWAAYSLPLNRSYWLYGSDSLDGDFRNCGMLRISLLLRAPGNCTTSSSPALCLSPSFSSFRPQRQCHPVRGAFRHPFLKATSSRCRCPFPLYFLHHTF